MAHKLAGQRAKFSRARAQYYTSSNEASRQRAILRMSEVIDYAPGLGFTEEQVTQGEDIPDEVRRHLRSTGSEVIEDALECSVDDTKDDVTELDETVDISDLKEVGEGTQFVYAYGYACAPDRMKIGRCEGDVKARVAAQIGTGTPDKPSVYLIIRTEDCAALERVLHGIFRLRGRRVSGAGAEWFTVSRDEILEVFDNVAVSDGSS